MNRLLALTAAVVFGITAAAPAQAKFMIDPNRMAAAAQDPYSMLEHFFSSSFEWMDRAWPILKANTEHCPKDVAYQPGFGVFPVGIQSRKDRKQIVKNGGKLGVKVFRVYQDSPALEAGILKGDVITAINGEEVDTGKNAPEKYYDQFEDQAESGEPVRLSIFRAGQDIEVTVPTVKICDYHTSMIADTGQVTMAGRHGELQLNPVFLSAAETENDKLVLLAHEIAHHMSGHVKAKSALSKVGGVLDKAAGFTGLPTFGGIGAAGAMVTRPGDEKEADELSMKLLASIGVSTVEAADLWARIFQDAGGTYRRLTSSHPMTEKRMTAMAELAAPERARLAAEAEAAEQARLAAEAEAAERARQEAAASASALEGVTEEVGAAAIGEGMAEGVPASGSSAHASSTDQVEADGGPDAGT